jgi:hypothetical protein
MPPDAKPLTDAQRQALCQMMYRAFLEIRSLGASGTEQAARLADAFHNLPSDLWQDDFSLTFFRDAFLGAYQAKYPRSGGCFDYVTMANEIIAMNDHSGPSERD